MNLFFSNFYDNQTKLLHAESVFLLQSEQWAHHSALYNVQLVSVIGETINSALLILNKDAKQLDFKTLECTLAELEFLNDLATQLTLQIGQFLGTHESQLHQIVMNDLYDPSKSAYE